MNKKLFTQLKTDHANLGLTDELLQAYADSLVSTGLVTDENITTISQKQSTALKAFQSTFDKMRGDKSNVSKEAETLKVKLAELESKLPKEEKKDDNANDIEKRIQESIQAAIKPLSEKLVNYETKEAQSKRMNNIVSKAKELGIPQWRIDEGFSIQESDTDEVITTTLSKVKQNIVAASLGKNGGLQIDTETAPEKEDVDAILKKIGV